MNTTIKSATVLLAMCAASAAFAQAKAPEPDYTVSFNAGATTDYRYRGISQSRLQPALQGGADFNHKSGFYLGTWASTIKWVKDGGGKSNVEIDVYGGYKTEISKDLTLDVGVLTYVYPSNNLNPSADTTEVYGALTFGPVTAKYSHSTTNLFGFANSSGSGYLDLSASFDMGNGWTVAPHLGRQTVKNNGAFSYTDYSVTLSKDLGGGVTASAAVIGTDSKAYVSPALKNLGKSGLVLGVKYAF
jgi:uncharacterized protein (TIGR02001 family)